MTYQVLARKWRPQDFSSLVGQEHVVTALGNGLNENRVAQAYLFSGIRGVGKTTAARVLAKALNCENGPKADPCNDCASCREITDGHSLDVIEVDAATYSKVEQVRELTETLRYGPARGRYKVVVLDEVHRLSRQAFDALLKIVEEPPAHLVFIFATTEIDAVPATILSRCQEFQFRRVASPVLASHLRTICDAEEITVSDTALRMIARAGEGSVRDAVALLDQMSTFGSGTISDEEAQRLLGGLDTAIFQGLILGILEGRCLEIVAIVREIEASGWDPHNVYSQFLSFVRDALHLSMGGDLTSVDLPEEEAATLRDNIAAHGYEALLQVLQLLIESERTVRRSELSLLALEIAWLRAAELPKVARIQDLLAGVGTGGAPPPPGGSAKGSSPETRSVSARALPEPPPAKNLVSQPNPSPAQVSGSSVQASGRTTQPESVATEPPTTSPGRPGCDPASLPDLLEIIGARRQSLAAHLSLASLRFDHRTLLIAPPADDTLLQSALGRTSNTEALEQALDAVWGEGVGWRIEAAAGRSQARLESPGSRNGHSPAAARGAPRRAERGRSSRADSPSDSGSPTDADFFPDWPSDSAPGPPPGWDHGPTTSTAAALPEAQVQEVSQRPIVRSILDLFGGKILHIEEASGERAK